MMVSKPWPPMLWPMMEAEAVSGEGREAASSTGISCKQQVQANMYTQWSLMVSAPCPPTLWPIITAVVVSRVDGCSKLTFVM